MMCKKLPGETYDYWVDWSEIQPHGDVIRKSTWDIPSGLTLVSTEVKGQKAGVWISGGSVGETYTITNHIAPSIGDSCHASMDIQVCER